MDNRSKVIKRVREDRKRICRKKGGREEFSLKPWYDSRTSADASDKKISGTTIVPPMFKEPLDKLAIIADKVSEVVGASSTICVATTVPPPSQSSSCSAQPTMDSLARQIQELSLQVAELTRERNSSRHQRYSSDRRRSHSRSRSVNRGSGICYYHRRYKEQARKCVSPCAFVQKNE
ncbi:hypothetical protein TNCV_721421 [Trichonephila clavipes]|nr:hypothetical protein TNCV_721421 [Trichonephila clavipes]